MRTQFDQSQRLMNTITDRVSSQLLEVTKGVTETKESTRQVFTIAEQLHNLEKVLKNQKQRGNLGESSLELILSNVLPGQYEAQYQFRDGEKVDFVVKTPTGLLPIDSKFPLENYLRLSEMRREQYQKDFKSDIKKRIDETSKYIRPEEGTMPFAIMFIPAEGIFYDLMNSDVGVGVNSRDLIEYAFQQKNVIIAAPTTFLAHVKTILFGNQRMKIQEAAKDIIKNVSELAKHLNAYQESHNSLGKSLSAAVGHFEKSGKAFKQIDKDVLRITDESIDLKLQSVDKPMLALDE
jgi:DNA recombination protein RmuC